MTTLAELIEPMVFQSYLDLEDLNLNTFRQVGVTREDPTLNSWLQEGRGRITEIPHYRQLDEVDPRTGTEDSNDVATHNIIRTTPEFATKMEMNNSWHSADLLMHMVGNDPMQAIARMVASYWAWVRQRCIVQLLRGIYLSNSTMTTSPVNGTQGDMIVDITAGAGAVTAANLISRDAIINTKLTMGDRGSELVMMICHSVVKARLSSLGLIDFVSDKDQNLNVPTFLGMIVVEDDRVFTEVNAPNVEYTTYFLSRGSILEMTARAKVPVEIERRPEQGNGHGFEELYNRIIKMVHVPGFSWNQASLGVAATGAPTGTAHPDAGAPNITTNPGGLTGVTLGPSVADLADGGNWVRTVFGPQSTLDPDPLYMRKYVGVAFLVTNG